MMLRRYTLLLLLLATGIAAQAQTVFSSLEDLWKYADDHNINIKAAKYEVDKTVYTKKQSYLAFLPQASASASFTDNTSLQTTLIPATIFGGPEGQYQPVQFGQKYIYAGGFTAQMDLVNLQTWFNVRIAKETEALNEASLSNTKKITYSQIAGQYYSYLLNKEAARVAELSASVADSVYQSVNNKFNEGTLSKQNVDVAQLNKERAEQTQITAGYQMRTSLNTLKVMLDLSVKDSIIVEGALQSNLSIEKNTPFAEDPSVRLAGYQAQLNLASYRAANANYLPTLSLIYNNTTQQNDNKYEPFESGGPKWYPANYWSLRASWTIFNGGLRRAQAGRNKLSYYEARSQYESSQKQSAINDENIRLSYQKAAASFTKAQDIMRLSFDNYQHVSDRYKNGIGAIDDRLSAFRDYLDYQNQYLNSLSDMLVQLYQVKIRQQSF